MFKFIFNVGQWQTLNCCVVCCACLVSTVQCSVHSLVHSKWMGEWWIFAQIPHSVIYCCVRIRSLCRRALIVYTTYCDIPLLLFRFNWINSANGTMTAICHSNPFCVGIVGAFGCRNKLFRNGIWNVTNRISTTWRWRRRRRRGDTSYTIATQHRQISCLTSGTHYALCLSYANNNKW